MKSLNAEMLKEHRTGQNQFSDQQWERICHLLVLSKREELVCRLLCDGNTRVAIAEAMGVSTRTVRHHMEQIHRKLEVRNRVGVVLRLIQVRDTAPSAHESHQYGPIIPTQQSAQA